MAHARYFLFRHFAGRFHFHFIAFSLRFHIAFLSPDYWLSLLPLPFFAITFITPSAFLFTLISIAPLFRYGYYYFSPFTPPLLPLRHFH
jgi:hypothetical protein